MDRYNTMFSFKEWYNTPVYEDDDIIIEEVPMSLVEAHILGYSAGTPDPTLRKYRVTFKSYKHQKALRDKLSDREVVYVIGENPGEVRDRVADYIQERKAKYVGDSGSYKTSPTWMGQMRRKDMDIKIKEIKTWKDLIDMLEYIASGKAKYKNDLFTHHDLSIVINKYDKSRDFWAEINKLPKDVQLLLKNFLRRSIQDTSLPADLQQRLAQAGKYQSSATKGDILRSGVKNLGVFTKERAVKTPDQAHGLHKYSTITEITKEARKYGITDEVLRKRAMEIAAHHSHEATETQKIWADIHEHLRRMFNNRRGWQASAVGLDWTNSDVIEQLNLSGLLAQIKQKYPRYLPGAPREALRRRLGLNIKMTTETRTPITTLSSVTVYRLLGGTNPEAFASHVYPATPDEPNVEEPIPGVNVMEELTELARQRFTNQPHNFANFVNYILSNHEDTIPAVRLYHRGRSIVGYSPALQMDFDVGEDGIHLIAKPNATVSVVPTKTYIRVTYKVDGGTTYGTSVFLYILGSQEVDVKMTNISRVTR